MRRLRVWQIAVAIAAGLLAGLAHAGLLTVLIDSTAIAALGGADETASGLVIHLALSALMGIAYAWLFKPSSVSYAETLMSGLTYGLFWWVLLSLNLTPILMSEGPQWEVEAAASAFPFLIGYILQGAIVGLGYHFLSVVAVFWLAALDERVDGLKPRPVQNRIVIVGGGFAGVTTAQHLERLFARDEDATISLISNTNHLLFTPMLSEVTAGSVEAQHISTSLRAFFRRTQVIRAEVEAVDFSERMVRLAARGGLTRPSVPFDHLVLAIGAASNFFGLQRVEAQAFTFKSLEDATLLRNHVIEMLERADAEPDAERRKTLLTFVVVGGGFAGTELIGGLNDFVRGSLWFYPNISPEEVALILVQSGERILAELGSELAEYAYEKLKTRGVTFKLRSRVVDAVPGTVILSSGETIPSETLVWTAGNSPHPLIRRLGPGVDAGGAVKTEATLRVAGHSNVWAVGDCADILDSRTGKRCPRTAQHALRQAVTLAHNIHAVIRGGEAIPFSYRSLGSFAVLGYHTACAEIYGLRFSGLFAWWLWRTIYLAKLPTLEKKIRVALDWMVDLFFPRDIVQTMSLRHSTKGGEALARSVEGYVHARR